jgi:hypothetical protein
MLATYNNRQETTAIVEQTFHRHLDKTGVIYAEDLPKMDYVSPTIRKQILEGKDVNLACLLTPKYEIPNVHSLQSVVELSVAVFTGGREFEGCTSAATAALSVAWFVSTFIGSPLLGIVRSTAVFVLARYSWRTISTFHVGSTSMPVSLRSLTYLSLVQCLRSLESLTLALRFHFR